MKTLLILASRSPRRKELLTAAGIPFEVITSRIVEKIPKGLPTASIVESLARQKAQAVAQAYPGRIVLAADTLVEVQGQILGKPESRPDAERMLGLLSGNLQSVITGVAIIDAQGREYVAHAKTEITMRRISASELQTYLDSGEWMDKAGAYAIQETADQFVTKMAGPLDNVVGLPIALVRKLLAQANVSE